ncbi:LysR family transcriptional regulator [Pseudomonas sp.]|uniref:LysR family transcriptional regulator n=1 Tax=Pseudomonas sp. TaxID=306 RepID=UPI0028A9CD39|nr:LysR family transcriptional regulator [Pseudomonas sp.]
MTLGLLPHFVNTAALRYFYEVARHGSFKVTEEKIHIAASAIRRQIQLLEQELDTKLFVRDRNGLRLTSAGESLLYRVKRAMKELSIARSEIDILQGEHTGNVRIGINETAAREFLAGFLQEFREAYPRITFEIVTANSNQLTDIMMRGEVDIIVGYALELQSGLQQVVSYNLQTCITVHKEHPLANRASVKVADLVDENFIIPSGEQSLHHVINAVFSRVAVKPMFSIVANSFEFIAVMVAQGMGIGCQVRLSVGPDPMRPDIVYVPIRDAKIKSAILACYIPEEGTSNKATLLCLESLRTALDRWSAQSMGNWQEDDVSDSRVRQLHAMS